MTVLAGTSEAFAPVMVAMVTSPHICRTAHPGAACLHTASADVMDITESSISFARPGFTESRHSLLRALGRTPFPTPALGHVSK